MNPIVSVILTTYNRPQFLREAVDSILSQTLKNLELVIVDDGSETPETKEICKHYMSADQRVKVIRQTNGGLSNARNNGAAATSGKYIATMDDDDIALPTRIEKQVNFLEEHPHVAAVSCGVIPVNKKGERIKPFSSGELIIQELNPPLEGVVKRQKLSQIGPHSVTRRDAYQEIGGFDEKFRIMEDIDFSLRIEEKYIIAKIPEGLYLHRQHDSGNLCKNPLAWHYFCAAYILAYFRQQGEPPPNCALTDLITHLDKLPEPLLHSCVRFARSTAKSFLRTKDYATLQKFLSDINAALPASHRSLKAGIYLRVFLWSIYHGKLGGLSPALKNIVRSFY